VDTIRPRQYKATASDFPITVEVTAVELADNLAIIGSVREVADGVLVARKTPVVSTPSALIKRYVIDRPTRIPCDVTHHVDGWFSLDAPGTARYGVTIVSATGDAAQAILRVPSINPNFANFSFSVS
jgi:hypothetical protein